MREKGQGGDWKEESQSQSQSRRWRTKTRTLARGRIYRKNIFVRSDNFILRTTYFYFDKSRLLIFFAVNVGQYYFFAQLGL